MPQSMIEKDQVVEWVGGGDSDGPAEETWHEGERAGFVALEELRVNDIQDDGAEDFYYQKL